MVLVWCSGGCGSAPTLLPQSVELALPDDSTTIAERGGGIRSLAQSKWRFFDGEFDEPMFVAEFDADGSLVALTENTILAAEVFGDALEVDGLRHSTAISGLTYTAITYGAENESGLAVQTRALAFFSGVNVGTGRVNVTGIVSEDRIDGTFDYSFTVQPSLESLIPSDIVTTDTFPFYAEPVE